MSKLDPKKQETADRFGKHAEGYATSQGHSSGDDLAIVLDLLKPKSHWNVLDIATGAGHTAALVAPHVATVVASDISAGMLAQAAKGFKAKGITNATTALADVEQLHFGDESFDAVTSRIAPHHFYNIKTAIAEMARVLKSEGVLVIEDNIAPQAKRADRFINDLEKARDSTHVRSYTKGEWRRMLIEAGFRVVRVRNYRKKHDIAEWVGRSDLSEAEKQHLYDTFAGAPEWARKRFVIEYAGGKAVSFMDEKVILRAIKD